jgi:hypothetical protein
MNAALQNANGPASVGALPDLGSIHTGKDKEMNSTKDSTGAAGTPDLRSMVLDLEDPIANATRMASVLAHLLEDGLDEDLSRLIGTNGKDRYHLTTEQRENIMFVLYQTEGFIREVYLAWQEAIQ